MKIKKESLSSLISHISNALHATHQELCQQYAWWLLEHITGKTKTQLHSLAEIELTPEQQQQLTQAIHELTVNHKPLAYILGWVPFGELKIITKPPILIPRPETEEWVLHLIEQLKTLNNTKLTILDMCTGSGCIALALAHALPNAHVTGVDISKQALALAQENAQLNNIHNVTFLQSDLFDRLAGKQFDIIVSNPPYIAHEERKDLDQSVTTGEDPRALFADDHGLSIITKLITQSPYYIAQNDELREKGIPNLAIEIGYTQGNNVAALMTAQGYTNIQIDRDSAGKDRLVKAQMTHVATTQNIT